MISQSKTWSKLSDADKNAILSRPVARENDDDLATVRKIVAAVREDGDRAIRRLTNEIDGIDIDRTLVTADEIAWAQAQLSEPQIAAIDLAISNVRKFHEAYLPQQVSVETLPGIRCEVISQAIEAVGLYVPAGTAPLPSTAIMLSVPAAIANCPERIMCTPPRSDGRADPAVLVAATRSGTDRIYKIGGAQAIAAMAFGTNEIPRVDKIFGPGNSWVTAAKTAVANEPGGPAIDMPAGPSEVLIIADETANPSFIASDLLSQAEHGADSQVILLTTSEALADEVAREVQDQLQTLSRKEVAASALEASSIVVVRTIDDAVEISNRYAPEHLIIQTQRPRQLLVDIRNAGSVFLGPWSPEAAGDYCSGTNHVLPTYGHARSYSGLSVEQFMRKTTIQELSLDGLRTIAPAIDELAGLEGLDAHANAVRIRIANTGAGQ